MSLRARLNRIYGQTERPADAPREEKNRLPLVEMASYLGGDWIDPVEGTVLRIARTYDSAHRHGDIRLSELNNVRRETAALLSGEGRSEPSPDERLLFLDTETTGLAGGAGTYVFLVGIGYLQGDSFVVHQFLLADYPSEAAFLQEVAHAIRDQGPFDRLVTFNGKSYDLNLLANRFVMQRQSNPFGAFLHLDLLHPCRLLWKRRFENCRLQTLERRLLGFVRRDDFPSHLIPQAYFSFLRTGFFRPFGDVLKHNRLDILSLAALTILCAAVIDEPSGGRLADPLSAARLLFLRGQARQAATVLENALESWPHSRERLDWLLELAPLLKRQRRFADSLHVWRNVLREHPDPPAEAFHEPAKILEHRFRDLRKALRVVDRGMKRFPSDPDLLRRKLRLERKLAALQWQ